VGIETNAAVAGDIAIRHMHMKNIVEGNMVLIVIA